MCDCAGVLPWSVRVFLGEGGGAVEGEGRGGAREEEGVPQGEKDQGIGVKIMDVFNFF